MTMTGLGSNWTRILAGAAIGALVFGTAAKAQEPAQGQAEPKAQEQSQEQQTEGKDVVNFLSSNDASCSVYPQFVAQGLGFWDDLGIEVKLLSTETTVPSVAFLQNGDADIVFLDAPSVLQAVDSNLPIKVIYEAYQASSEGIIVPAESPIRSLSDLKDITIGLASDRDFITTVIALDSIGTTPEEANIETVVVGGSGPTMAAALRDGTIDAFAGGSSDRAGIEAAGVEIRNITSSAVTQTPGNVFTVWGPAMEEKRDVIERFLQGWAMAQLAGVIDTSLTASVCRTFVPEQFEDVDVGLRMINNAVYNTQQRRTQDFGELQPDVWAAIQQIYVKLGEVKEEHDPSTFLDPSFIEAANDFTTADVKEKIKTWRQENPDKLIE